jgi:succinate dehydrogenase/fumarate reductase flavoprotein subunit
VQALARWPGGKAWYRVHERDLRQRVRERTVGEMMEAARAAGGTVLDEPPYTSVLVQASVTQTLGGLRIDDRARVLGDDGAPLGGLFAAGADAGGISTGGYSSGLAAALVFGRIAAQEALSW